MQVLLVTICVTYVQVKIILKIILFFNNKTSKKSGNISIYVILKILINEIITLIEQNLFFPNLFTYSYIFSSNR